MARSTSLTIFAVSFVVIGLSLWSSWWPLVLVVVFYVVVLTAEHRSNTTTRE
jgi:hypothetical protein